MAIHFWKPTEERANPRIWPAHDRLANLCGDADENDSDTYSGNLNEVTCLKCRELALAPSPQGEGRDFSYALMMVRNGQRVCRTGWNGKGMWVALQRPDAHSKMSLPYLYMKTADDELVPWLASQTDLLAEDWTVL